MNYDLITKLAKLANNNPNEHEANLAARKVCKLLAEGKFEFGVVKAPIQNPLADSRYKRPSAEPRPVYEQQKQDFYAYFNQQKWWYQRGPKEWSIPKEEQYYGPDNFKTASQQKEERDLKCKTCGKIIKTKFVGLPEIFQCNTCLWNAYLKDRDLQNNKDR